MNASHANNDAKYRSLIDDAIRRLGLQLNGLTVLTEAATGYYRMTPLIAALAGAEAVYALAKDSRFGTAESAMNGVLALAKKWVSNCHIEVFTSREDPRISQADVVTNLGFVRPLDEPFLKRLKPTAVIPLMWEAWEFRPEDMDLAACRRLGIPVVATDEHHPDLRIFDSLGVIVVKLLKTLGVEAPDGLLLILGKGHFADAVCEWFEKAGVRLERASLETPKKQILEAIKKCKGLVVTEHQSRAVLIGPGGLLEANELKRSNPSLKIAHLCGNVDSSSLKAAGLQWEPAHIAPAGYMSAGLEYAGPKPLIDLHTAGLKIGECMARARKKGLSGMDVEKTVLRECSLAQELPAKAGH